jgi:hypothetical protein
VTVVDGDSTPRRVGSSQVPSQKGEYFENSKVFVPILDTVFTMVIDSKAHDEHSHYKYVPPSAGYVVEEHPLGEPRKLRVITIGAGASGLNIAYQIGKHMKNVDLQLYEKNNEVGGTWLENRFGLSRILGKLFVDLHDTDTLAAPVIFHHIVINILGRPIQTGTNC